MIALATMASMGCVLNVESNEVEKTATSTETGWTVFHSNIAGMSGEYAIHGVATGGARATARVSGLVISGQTSDLAAQTSMQFTRSGNSLELELSYLDPSAESVRFESLSVDIPAATEVFIDGTAGSVRATGLTGQVIASTSVGEINVDTTGPMQLVTSNGRIHATGTGGSARTSNGEIALTWNPVEPLDVATSNGSVDVRVPRGMGFDLDVSTSNGSIEVHVGQSRIVSEHIGPINGGGPLLHIRTSNGAVSVHE